VVTGISVEGNQHISQERVLFTFGVRIGDELTADAVREGIRKLYGMGYFSDVRVSAEPSEDGTVKVIIGVEERPKVQTIDIRGNDHVSKKDIESVLRVEVGSPYTASRLEDSRVSIEDLYERKGFPEADITTEVQELNDSSVAVTISVKENTRVIIKEIRFSGNTAIDASDLKKVMETKEDRWWRTDAYFDRNILDQDLTKIADRYHQAGYIDAVVPGYDTSFDEDGKRVTVTINVDEGGLYTVSDVEWTGASDFAVNALEDLTELEVGDTYEPPLIDNTIQEAYNWYGERGYIHARIVGQEDVEDDQRIKVTFVVDEADPAHIGEIHITGNERTKEKVIRRELVVSPGDLYQTSEIIASQRKIANLGFFDGPTVEFATAANPRDIDLIFNVRERQTGRAGVGVSHTSEKGITGFVELNEGNLFGNGQYLDLKWEFGKKNSEVVLGFTEPWFMNRRLSVGFDLYDTNDKRIYTDLPDEFYQDAFPDSIYDQIASEVGPREFTLERDRRGGDLRVGMPLFGSQYTMVYGKYTLEQFRTRESADVGHDTSAPADEIADETITYKRPGDDWEWRSGVTGTLVRRTTDRRFFPRLGSYNRFSADLFGGAFGGDVEYQRYILDTSKYVPSFWTTTLMLRGRAGVVTGFGDPATVPDDVRFELGGVGVNGVRGYENRSILPEGSELYGGRTMLLGSAELRFPITSEESNLPLRGLFFVDAGNTWDSAADTHPTDLYWGVGAGVRVEVPILGNMGVDFGYGLDEDKGRDWVVHYQFGLEF
jgi:outer membrane protein insertion porin family